MCLEVEEIMYQDTVKYVKDQVQTVGSNVKKFLLDVVEDFLPPSSIDVVKGKVKSNVPSKQNSDVGICKKPKIGIEEEAIEVDSEQLSEASLPTTDLDKDADCEQSFHGFHVEDSSFQAASGDAIKGACSDVYSNEYDARSGHNQSIICMQKISKEKSTPSETTGEIPHMERDVNGESSSSELVDRYQEASDDNVAANPTSVITQVAGHNPIEEINDELENGSKVASGVLTSSPSATNCDEIENLSASSSCSCPSAELNGLSNDSTMDTLESSVIDKGFETIQQVDNIQVEETCVLVNGDELRFVPRKESKPRPYKKNIQGAILSRMIFARKHEYKQLAMLHDEEVRSSRQENAEMKRLPPHGSRELEWELLSI